MMVMNPIWIDGHLPRDLLYFCHNLGTNGSIALHNLYGSLVQNGKAFIE